MRDRVQRTVAALCSAAIIAAIFIAGCTDSTSSARTEIAPAASPSLEIKDASNGSPAGFNWITPIAPLQGSYPAFDGTRSPVVEICEWVSGACKGPLVESFSGANITVSIPGQYYRVDWTTTSLPSGVLYRIRVLEGGVELGHADAEKPLPPETAQGLTNNQIVPLGNSATLPIRFRLSNRAPSVTITAPSNGDIIPVTSVIDFIGSASDPEDGDLSSKIVWTSNLVPGKLGTGKTIEVTLPGGRHTITASITDAGGLTTTASIQIVVSIVSVPATLNVPLSGTASLPITLSSPAPTGGIIFNVTSANPHVGVLTPMVLIGEGAVSGNATLSGASLGTAKVTVSNADYGTVSSDVSTTADLNIVETSVTFTSDLTQQITIKLQSAGADIAAPPGGLVVNLTPGSVCAVAVSPVTIQEGQVSTTSTISYGSGGTPCTTKVTASAPGFPQITTDFVNVSIKTPTPVMTITQFGGTVVGAGLRQQGITDVVLGQRAPVGGVTVTLTSSAPTVALAAPSSPAGTVATAAPTVFVPEGAETAFFVVDGVENVTGTATFTATAPGYSDASVSVSVVGLALQFSGSQPENTNSLAANSPMRAQIGAINGGVMGPVQAIRPGGTAHVVTFTNSDFNVAQLVTTAATGNLVTATIGVGESVTPSGAANGGADFDPLNGGTTIVTISSPQVTAVPVSSRTVVVTAPALSITQFSGSRVGAGLRIGGATEVSLTGGAEAPAGGLVVTLTSGAPSVARAAPSSPANTVASAAPTVFVPEHGTSALFVIDGMEGASGPATFTATALGFTSATTTVTVAPVGVRLSGSQPGNTNSFAANIPFGVEIGPLDVAGTSLAGVQAIRPGGLELTVQFTNSMPSVARLVTIASTGQVVTARIAVGQSTTPQTEAAGGVEFDPLGGGTTIVAISGATLTAVAPSSRTVVVTAPALSITQFGGSRVGTGLRVGGATQVSLPSGTSAPAGGLVVTLTSGTPSVARAAANTPVPTLSTTAPTVVIPEGGTSALFLIDGMEHASGDVTFTASAPGYLDATTSITVAGLAIQFAGSAPTNTTSLSNNSTMSAQVGAVDAAGTAMGPVQAIRPGGSAITVTFANSNHSVAQLVTSAKTAQSVTADIPIGANHTPFGATAGGADFDPLGGGTTTVSISAPGITSVPTSSRPVIVTAPALTITLFGSGRVGAGLRQGGVTEVTLGAPAPAGGITVTLTSTLPSILRAAPNSPAGTVATAAPTVNVAAGGTTAFFVVDGMEGASGTTTITATAPGFTDGTESITVAGVGLRFRLTPPAATTKLSNNSPVAAEVGVLNAAGTAMAAVQAIRPGGTAKVVTFTNSVNTVARLITQAATAQTVTATIPVGASQTPLAESAGGVDFDPVDLGTTTVAISASGVTLVPTSSQLVTVSTPKLSITQFGTDRVGTGLRQTGTTEVSLEAPAPAGGLNVTLTSSVPSVAMAAPSSPAGTIATPAPTVFVAAGGTTAFFVVDGIGTPGAVTFTASAPGFVDATTSVTVAPVALQFGTAPPTSIGSSAANSNFTAQVGALNVAGTAMGAVQAVRPGGAALTLTFTNTISGVAQLVTTALSGHAVSATIGVGASATPNTVAGGGVAFDPMAAGSSTVSVGGVGLTPVPTSAKTVTVTP